MTSSQNMSGPAFSFIFYNVAGGKQLKPHDQHESWVTQVTWAAKFSCIVVIDIYQYIIKDTSTKRLLFYMDQRERYTDWLQHL